MFADWGSTAFWIGYVGLLLLFLVGLMLQKGYPAAWYIRPLLPKAKNPASIHEVQLLLLTTFLPGAMMAGFLYTARYLPPVPEAYALSAIWFAFAYVISFTILRFVYGGIFLMEYIDDQMSSLVVAKAYACRALKRFDQKRSIAGTNDLQKAYVLTADWLRSTGYVCPPVDSILRELSAVIALEVKTSEHCLRSLAEALQDLPNWPDVVTKLSNPPAELAWVSSIQPRPTKRARKAETSVNAIIALGTVLGALVTPFLVLYSAAFLAAMSAISSSMAMIATFVAASILMVICYVRWRRFWKWVVPDLASIPNFLEEKRAAKRKGSGKSS